MDRDNFALASVQVVFKKVEQQCRNSGEMPGFHTSFPYFCIYMVVECYDFISPIQNKKKTSIAVIVFQNLLLFP